MHLAVAQVLGTRQATVLYYCCEKLTCVAEGSWALGPITRVLPQSAGVR